MYSILGLHFSKWLMMLIPLAWFARLRIKPEHLDGPGLTERLGGRPVVFVMPRFQLLDLLMLNLLLRRWGFSQVRSEAKSNSFAQTAFLSIRSQVWLFYPAARRDPFSEYLQDLIENDSRLGEQGIALQPVSVFWSRGAEKTERNFLIRSFFPDDGNAIFLQKILLFLFHRGRVDVHFGKTHILTPDSFPEMGASVQPSGQLNEAEQVHLEPLARAKRYRRALLAELNRERTAALGPTLYDFNTVVNWILGSEETQKMLSDSPNHLRAQRKAFRYLKEIAANYNYTTIRAFEVVFDFVWTRIFKGVRVRNFERVREVARTGRILWMPCHRSHLDYMLLSYVMFKGGMACPHIAAGVNLSFWPAGPILRRGGAFFMRRSFSGNKLYTRVFEGYIDFLMHNGYGIEFFHEGGRSRIGKLMSPRFGVTSFCVRSILRRKAANTYLVPVFIGYDKVMEDDSYAREVSGARKQKESAWQLLRSVRFLFSNYGRVDVSFGEPVHFGELWKSYMESAEKMGRVFRPQSLASVEAREAALQGNLEELTDDIDVRHPIVRSFVESLALRVNEEINGTAVASGTALLATVMIALANENTNEAVLRERFEQAAWMVSVIGAQLGLSLSNSFSASEGSFALTKGKTESAPAAAALPVTEDSANGGAESSSSAGEDSLNSNGDVLTLPIRDVLARTAFSEAVESCKKWGFLEAVPGDGSVSKLRSTDAKALNWYWYRGTVFHVFAAPGVAARILQFFARNGVSETSVDVLLMHYQALRDVWRMELFWPKRISTRDLLDAGLRVLEHLGVIRLASGQITVLTGSAQNDGLEGHPELSPAKSLDFVAGLILPEREIYALQITAALKLVEARGGFKRDELVHQTFLLHRSAFLRGLVSQPPSLTRVYGKRSFEALFQMGMYVPKEGQLMNVSFDKLDPLVGFFDIESLSQLSI